MCVSCLRCSPLFSFVHRQHPRFLASKARTCSWSLSLSARRLASCTDQPLPPHAARVCLTLTLLLAKLIACNLPVSSFCMLLHQLIAHPAIFIATTHRLLHPVASCLCTTTNDAHRRPLSSLTTTNPAPPRPPPRLTSRRCPRYQQVPRRRTCRPASCTK